MTLIPIRDHPDPTSRDRDVQRWLHVPSHCPESMRYFCIYARRGTRKKLSLFCQVDPSHVISVKDVTNTYRVPLLLQSQRLPELLFARLDLTPVHPSPRLEAWTALADAADAPFPPLTIAIVGKYCKLQDAYLSVLKALNHACMAAKRKLVVTWISGEALEKKMEVRRGVVWFAVVWCGAVGVLCGWGVVWCWCGVV